VKRRQLGATAIEFALVLLVFLMFLLGVLDFARMLFTWSGAAQAARAGARYAAACMDTSGDTAPVLARMQGLLPQVQSVDVSWEPAGCSPATCERVRVGITDLQYRWMAPVPGLASVAALAMPRFDTTLPRESMRQDTHSSTLCNP